MFHAFVCLVCVNYMAMKIPPDILINFIAVDVDRACEQREERNEDRTSDAGWLCYCCAPFLSLLTMCDCGVSCSFGGESLSLSSGISFVQFRCGAAMRSRSAIRCYGMRTYLWRNRIVRCANGRFEFLVLCNSMRDFIENAQSTSFFIHTTDEYSNWWWMKPPLCQWSWQYTVIFSSQRCIQWPPAMPALAKYGKLLRINQHFSQYKTPHTSYGRQLASIKHISSKSLIRIGIRTSGSYITQ